MALKKLLLSGIALIGAAAFAQTPIGTVVNVQGVVTAAQGGAGATVTPGSPIRHGMRFVTTSTGRVTLRLASGCVVILQPNQAVTVLQEMTCPQLLAAVTPVTAVPVATVTPVAPVVTPVVAPGVVGGLIAAGALGIVAQIINIETEDEPSVSPN